MFARWRRDSLTRNHDFMTLWAGESVSLLGTQVTLLALPLTAALTMRATPLQMSGLYTAQTLSLLLLNLPAGVWVDRLSRRRVMLVANVGRALLLATLPLAALLGRLTLGQLYIVALLAGALDVFFSVAYQTYLPALVERERLTQANARLAASGSLARIVGPPLAGALIALLTAPLAIALDAASYLASAISLALIRRPEPRPTLAGGPRPGLLADLGAGLRYVARHPVIRTLAGATGLFNLFSGMFLGQQVLYMTNALGLAPITISLAFAALGPGALLGTLLSGPLAQRLGVGRLLMLGVGICVLGDLTVALAGGSLAARLLTLGLGEALIGLGSPLYNITTVSLRQSITPLDLLGRVTASGRFIAVGALPLGALLGGLLAEHIGLRATLLVAALGGLAPLVWLALTAPMLTAARRAVAAAASHG